MRRIIGLIFFLICLPARAEDFQLRRSVSPDANGFSAYSVWLSPNSKDMEVLNRVIRKTTDLISLGAPTLDAHVTLIGKLRFRDPGQAQSYFTELFKILSTKGPDGRCTLDRMRARLDTFRPYNNNFFEHTIIRLSDTQGLYEANRIAVDLYNRHMKDNRLYQFVSPAEYLGPQNEEANGFHLSLAYADADIELSAEDQRAIEQMIGGKDGESGILGMAFDPCSASLYRLGPKYENWTRVRTIQFR